MKKLPILLLGGAVLLSASSCKKYLDVNKNPNSATSTTPDLVLPEAIVYAANNASAYNDYGAEVGGYAANAGGYGGFGVEWTYDYATNSHTNLWSSGYDMIEDAQYVIDNTQGQGNYTYYNAAAKVIKAYMMEKIVDQYNDAPYSQAWKGANDITPAYDKASAIYQSLADLCDSAITLIDNAPGNATLGSGADPLFGGDMDQWKKFANTIKLKLIVHASAKMTFTNTTFSSDGFLTDDAVVNPGFALASGHTSPSWSDWVVSYTGSAANRAWVPSTYVLGFYNGAKLNDPYRGGAIYFDFPTTPSGQLGATSGTPNAPALGGAWYSGGGTTGVQLGNAVGIFKGPDMGEPLMLAAESYFLQAEAAARGLYTSGLDAKTAFNDGITASFTYLYEDPSLSVASGYDVSGDVSSYMSDNSTSYLVNYDLATTLPQQIEAIITQKYIAMNMITGDEAWNEYRRTGYPKSADIAQNNAVNSFASIQSTATRPDKLPTRLLYPNSEYQLNAANVPQDISPYTSLIFWAQ